MPDEDVEDEKIRKLIQKSLKQLKPASSNIVTPQQRRILHEIEASKGTIPLDLSLKLKQEVGDVETAVSEMAQKDLIETREGYIHLTYKGLKTLRQFEEEG